MNTTDTQEMSQKDLTQLAHRLITDKIGAGEIVEMDWAVEELIKMQGEIDGEGAPFYALCARECARHAVTEVMDSYDNRPKSADELLKHAKEIEEYVARRAAGTGQRKEMAE